jgi:hypothetical protein
VKEDGFYYLSQETGNYELYSSWWSSENIYIQRVYMNLSCTFCIIL